MLNDLNLRPRLQSPKPPEQRAAIHFWIRALENVCLMDESPTMTLPVMLEDLAGTYGDRPALLGEGECLSFRELAVRSNRYARWAVEQCLGFGDVVCLLMPNCPDYVAVWLGLTRVGCTVALLNTNLRADALVHSICAAGSIRLIVGNAHLPALEAIADRLSPEARVWVHGHSGHARWPAIESELMLCSELPLSPLERPLPTARDRALLIYTSGTTGLPKAANVTHRRVLEWSLWFAGMMDTQPDDRLYNCLPMYHSVGGVVAIGAMLVKGGSVLIRPRFSATRFWDDVTDGGCTIFQYIGELCRYLAAAPPHSKERLHRLRLACGNGLQADVWDAVRRRFGIPRILEFYAASEGGISLYNCEQRPGAIGRIPPAMAHRFQLALIRCDPGSGAPFRDAAGRCVECCIGEAGEAIGRIGSRPGPSARQFDGYTDPDASSAKILHDVFEEGDRWFRSGDLMRQDSAGYFYFVDRIGDTFRWKGENVSTVEVETVIRAFPGVTDAVVYGVAVPGHDGRAGMAAITTNGHFDITGLRRHLAAALPEYACPLFVRVCPTIETTGTFKPVKQRLAHEGYSKGSDPVWFNDRRVGQFVVCDATLRLALQEQVRRL